MLAGSGGVLPGIDMRDPRVQRAARLLAARGIPVTRVNLAEALALEGSESQAPAAPGQPGGMGQRTAPAGSAEERAERAIEEKRRQGPPAEMLRRQRRGM